MKPPQSEQTTEETIASPTQEIVKELFQNEDLHYWKQKSLEFAVEIERLHLALQRTLRQQDQLEIKYLRLELNALKSGRSSY